MTKLVNSPSYSSPTSYGGNYGGGYGNPSGPTGPSSWWSWCNQVRHHHQYQHCVDNIDSVDLWFSFFMTAVSRYPGFCFQVSKLEKCTWSMLSIEPSHGVILWQTLFGTSYGITAWFVFARSVHGIAVSDGGFLVSIFSRVSRLDFMIALSYWKWLSSAGFCVCLSQLSCSWLLLDWRRVTLPMQEPTGMALGVFCSLYICALWRRATPYQCDGDGFRRY